MVNPENGMQSVTPATVLGEIATAVPEDCRKHIIVVGSLAAGYHYRDQLKNMGVRTKDADCLLSPRVEAIKAGIDITERLLESGWTFHGTMEHPDPGKASTADDALPAVRLSPPRPSQWFIELMTVPEDASQRGRQWARLTTSHGHFGLPSFGFIGLTNLDPISTDFGISIARPEMMALANLLEHPVIGKDTMSSGFADRMDIKRSNKDLGRVLAIARLAVGGDEDALLAWSRRWKDALQERFPAEWCELAGQVGDGLRALLASEQDFEQAFYTCANGLLALRPPTLIQLRIVGRRLLQDAIEPLEDV